MKHILITITAVLLAGCNHIKPFDETKSSSHQGLDKFDTNFRRAGSPPSSPRIPMILPSGFPRINRE